MVLGMDCEGFGMIVGLGVVLRVLSRWRWSMAEVWRGGGGVFAG